MAGWDCQEALRRVRSYGGSVRFDPVTYVDSKTYVNEGD